MKKLMLSTLILFSVFCNASKSYSIDSPSPEQPGKAAAESTQVAKSSKVKVAGLIIGGLTIATIGILLASHNNGSHAHH